MKPFKAAESARRCVLKTVLKSYKNNPKADQFILTFSWIIHPLCFDILMEGTLLTEKATRLVDSQSEICWETDWKR